MKIHRSRKYLILLLLQLGFQASYCQEPKANRPLEFTVYTTKINFHYKDSILPFTLFTEPDGSFYFRQGFVSRPDSGISLRFIKNKHYQEVYSPIADSIVDIDCLFPQLISHDSVVVKKYPIEFREWDVIPHIFELENSFILKNLKEPSLYSCQDKRAIRIILSIGTDTYKSIRLEMKNSEATLYCSEGSFRPDGISASALNGSCAVNEKKRLHIEDKMNKLDFDKEQYFSSLNLSNEAAYWKVIIEYRNGNNYYVFRKTLKDKMFGKLVSSLLSLSARCKK
jgi:hypothetical protein